jgi:hypothetical protein
MQTSFQGRKGERIVERTRKSRRTRKEEGIKMFIYISFAVDASA